MEIELKFQLPAAHKAGLQRALATAGARRVHLQAVYADTADARLAGAGFALRLRKEGRRWVQTLKGRGDGLMQRLEHELALPPQRGTPLPDPALHAGTAAGAALAALLADGAALLPRYSTDIRRLQREVRHQGARIEIAFDEGHVVAGAHRLPVCEVEFELLSGPPAALLSLAATWAGRHGLWLDPRTKSERGHRLAEGQPRVPALKALPPALDGSLQPGQAFAAMLRASLAHLLPNAAEVASGLGSPEQLHQVRVALRRLRTVLRLFGAWSTDPAAARALEAALREPFRRLGARRDADALAATLLPALAAAGGPPLQLPLPPDDPAALLRESGLTQLLLRTLALAVAPGAGTAASEPALDLAADAVLAPRWRQAMAGARAFAGAEAAARHRTRRRLKRLRYGIEFLQPLLPRKTTARALQALGKALDALGAYNDILVAAPQFERQLAQDPRAWFALGWLAAERGRAERRAARRLRALAALKAPRARRR